MSADSITQAMLNIAKCYKAKNLCSGKKWYIAMRIEDKSFSFEQQKYL